MDITDMLNSGTLHDNARKRHPDCVDNTGNIHVTPERAQFVNWLNATRAIHGFDVKAWPASQRAEYAKRYVPSH